MNQFHPMPLGRCIVLITEKGETPKEHQFLVEGSARAHRHERVPFGFFGGSSTWTEISTNYEETADQKAHAFMKSIKAEGGVISDGEWLDYDRIKSIKITESNPSHIIQVPIYFHRDNGY